MGSSGAGKTTLLNLLAGRAQGKIEGQLLLNGSSMEESKEFRKHSTYIMQDDILLANQTPREILSFSSKMKISNEYTQVSTNLPNHLIVLRNKKRIESTKSSLNST
jgi:ABC-type multidrug transport system ATPase subunit